MAIKREAPKAVEKVKPAAKKAGAAPESKALVKAPERSVALVSAHVFEEDAAAAKGTFTKDDLMTPFLRVLQALSPQVQKKGEGYVEGAEQGMFINTANNELWDGEDGVVVIPVHYTPSFIEWRVRENKGGFVKDWGAQAPDLPTTRDDKNREILPNGNQLVKSGLYYIFIVDPETGTYTQAAMPLQGTQLKKSRKWNTLMQTLKVPRANGQGEFTPALFYMSYKLTTALESNDQGSWMGVNIESYKPVIELPYGANAYLAAKEFKDMIAAGKIRTGVIEEEVTAEVVTEGAKGGDGDEPY